MNAVSFKGQTALTRASQAGSPEVVALLLSAGRQTKKWTENPFNVTQIYCELNSS